MPDLSLLVGGKQYNGWKSVTVRRALESVCPTFDLLISERWAGQDQPWPITIGSACQVLLDGELVITGFVDDVMPFFDSQQHGVQVVGRGKTADLVDCSAIFGTGQWQNRKLSKIAADICKPFGIDVIAASGVDEGASFSKFALQDSETAYEALERLARQRAVFYQENAAGQLVISTASTQRISTPLVQGKNIKAASATFSLRDRFSQYTCKGQAVGFNFSTPEQNASPSGKAADANVSRYRPLIILAETPSDSGKLKDRAIWEAAVRMGRSSRPVLTFAPGWAHSAGLWQPNTLVYCKVPYFQLDREMLIAACAWGKDENGTRTEIELVLPEAFQLLAIEEKDEESIWG